MNYQWLNIHTDVLIDHNHLQGTRYDHQQPDRQIN